MDLHSLMILYTLAINDPASLSVENGPYALRAKICPQIKQGHGKDQEWFNEFAKNKMLPNNLCECECMQFLADAKKEKVLIRDVKGAFSLSNGQIQAYKDKHIEDEKSIAARLLVSLVLRII